MRRIDGDVVSACADARWQPGLERSKGGGERSGRSVVRFRSIGEPFGPRGLLTVELR
jgi:hypothetical protein